MKILRYDRLDESKDSVINKPRLSVLPNGDQILNIIDICPKTLPFKERENYKIILEMVEKNQMDTIVFPSLGKLGYNKLNILKIIKEFDDKGVNVSFEKENIKTKNEDKSSNTIIYSILNFLISLFQNEDEIRKQRQKEGIEKARLKGNYKNVGGKKPKLSIDQFFKKSKNLACLNELKKGNSIRKSAINSNLSAAQALKVKKFAEASGRL